MTDYAERVARLAAATRPPLQLVPGSEGAKPSAANLASAQVEAAIRLGERDLTDAPRWTWRALDRLVDAMLPGELIVVGGLYSNGKTSYLLSQLDAFAHAAIPVLYLPLEVDPPSLRRRWAAWALGYDWMHVARNEWEHLPARAQAQHNAMMARQSGLPVQFPPDRRVTIAGLADWVRWGLRELQARVVMIDHFHRMEFGKGDQYRIAVTEAARELKDLAVQHQVVVIASAQLNQHEADPFDRYHPPTLRRLKESSGLAEEPDAVLMLSRRLKAVLTKQDMLLVKNGFKSDRDFAEAGVMAVTCRKHRLNDALAGDRTVLLQVEGGGHVVDRERDYQPDQWLDGG